MPTVDAGASPVDAQGIETFFSIGAYLCCTGGGNADTIIADLTTLAEAGFNSASFNLGFDTKGKFDTVLATAARLGMRMIVENVVNVDGNAETVIRYKTQSGIFAWNIGDDLHRKYSVAQTKTMHDAVKRADPIHPDIGIVYNPNLWTEFAVADITGIYKYPVADIKDNGGRAAGQGALSTVDDWITTGRKLNKPIIGIPQAYAWPNDRFPSPAELRNMAFQMLLGNVQGLTWYAFGRSGSFLGPHRAAEWAAAKQIAKDVHLLVPDMRTGAFSRLADATSTIRAAQWKLPKTTLVMVVNTGPSTMVSIPMAVGAGATVNSAVDDSSAKLTLQNDRLVGNLAPLAVQVLRVGN